jgi:hypothetical protein
MADCLSSFLVRELRPRVAVDYAAERHMREPQNARTEISDEEESIDGSEANSDEGDDSEVFPGGMNEPRIDPLAKAQKRRKTKAKRKSTGIVDGEEEAEPAQTVTWSTLKQDAAYNPSISAASTSAGPSPAMKVFTAALALFHFFVTHAMLDDIVANSNANYKSWVREEQDNFVAHGLDYN